MVWRSILAIVMVLVWGTSAGGAAEPRISDNNVGTAQGYRLETVVDGLEHPWGMVWLPDGSLLVTERSGRLRRVRDGVLERAPLKGVPEVLRLGQGGLLDVALHPRFADNLRIYLSYAYGDRQANRVRVVAATLNGDRLDDLRVIFESSPDKSGGQHFGCRLVFLPDETLLISVGDGGNPPVWLEGGFIRLQAQKLGSRLGKILRVNADGSIPADNPFVGQAGADPAVWSYGHRNIQGLTVDPDRGWVWASEHGARGGDEINRIEGGKNYGWPEVTYSREYTTGLPISAERSRPGMQDPVLVWKVSIAASGLTLYMGERFPEWRGDLFAGGLVSHDVRRLDLDDQGRVVAEEAMAIGARVRDVRQGPDGLLYVLTDEDAGQLLRIVPDPGRKVESP
jgi:glucose/arabinose dehydrogenase